jgi:hypothetical protein
MSKHKNLVPDLKKWLKVHSVAFGVTATLIVVLSGVLSLYFIGSRFSPSSPIVTGSDGATIKLQVSDHNTNASPGLLPNSLTDGTAAEYTNNYFMDLAKVNGDIPNLFRMQGTLAYNSPNTTDKATVTISLPPRLLLTPARLAFGQDLFTFTGPNNNLAVRKDSGSGTETVAIEKVADADADARGEYYKITISNIDKKRFALNPFEQTQELFASINQLLETAQAYSPPPAGNILIFRRPYQFRLTFKQPVAAASVDSLVSYISERGEKDNIFFGNSSCGGSANERAYVCAKTTTQAFSPTTALITLPLHQKIELSGVYLSGNVAALIEIQNLKLFPNSVAVGGQLTNVTGTLLTNYLQNNPTSILKWSNTVDDQVTELFNRRGQGTTAQPLDTTAVWKLNSPTDDPDDSTAATTFSSPPEGKLWATPGSLTFGSDVTFNGSGTIVVNGNLTFNGQVLCSGAKRLAFIVRGNIVFNGTPNVACGAYVALGNASGTVPGHLRFNGEPPTGGAIARGIFVAKSDLQIPNAATAPQMIDYDADFAAKPTVLFREFMDLILGASS